MQINFDIVIRLADIQAPMRRCGQGAVQFAVYEALRKQRIEARGTEDLPWHDTFLSTTASKSFAMTLWYPVEVRGWTEVRRRGSVLHSTW